MAAACTVTPAVAARPLLPTPRLAGCASDGWAWRSSNKPGRASASESWTKDKLIARTSSSVPGRASLSEDWSKDKAERKETSLEHAGRSPSRESQGGAKRALSRAPSVEVDRTEKKVKPDVEKENNAEPVVAAAEVNVVGPLMEERLKKALSRAPSVEVDRTEKKAKPVVEKENNAETVAAVAELNAAGPSREVVADKKALSRVLSVEIGDRSEKKARPEDGFYAGPSFIKSPDPSELPIPFFVKSPHPSELPIPRFLKLKAPKAAPTTNN